jgi:crossover junction endodeoxyribonuclease RusA
MNSIRIVLPYPISANRYWRPVRLGTRITIVPTKEAKQYKADVIYACRSAGIKPISGRVCVHIDLFPQRPLDWQKRMRKDGAAWDDTVRCLDIDNARKVVYDALKGVAFDDDAWIWSDSADRCEPDGDARIVVHITAMQPCVAQPSLDLPEPARVADPLDL